MNVCVFIFIILMVIQAMTCEKAVSKLQRKLNVPKMNDKCKKIKCASVEEPQCVRMRRHDLSLTLHIIAANKCEMEYIKCHDDVEAKIVPMKYCSHDVGETAGEKKNKPGKAHIRVKRRVGAVMEPVHRQAESESNHNHKTKHPKWKKSRMNSKKLSLQWKNEDSNVITQNNDNRSEMKGRGAVHYARQPLILIHPFSSETDSDVDKNDKEKIDKDLKDNRPQPLNQQVESFWVSQELGPMLSDEAGKFSKESLIEADKEEYVKLCPTVCPSRDVMVCGRCQHGIYKTFISVCHLRMFACNYEDEIMQLVSRYPCVLSAPYLADSNMKPKGRVTEPGDSDMILRFIICREQGKLGTDEKPSEDPRCNFRPTKDKLKYYDYKGVDRHLVSHLLENEESSEY